MNSQSVTSPFLARFLLLARTEGARPVLTFVGKSGADEETLSFRETLEAAQTIGAQLLTRHGLSQGDRVLLVYPPSLDFATAFVGCLLAGLVPVPVCPPDPFNLERELPNLTNILADCGARALLTNRAYERGRLLGRVKDRLLRTALAWPDLPWIKTDALSAAGLPREGGKGGDAAASDLAFLQYTSGSTGSPRGVMISHANLAHQLELNARALGLGLSSRAVAWVPHFHDFGLISGILSALYGNGRLYLMSPLDFVARPALWLEVMSRVQATHTAAPNFGYDLAVRKTRPAERARLRLGSIEVAMSAAEPIRAHTVKSFLEAFGPSGFRPQAFCPSYGLAEHTVGVTVGGRATLCVDPVRLATSGEVHVADSEEAGGKLFFGCGRPEPEVAMRVVDPGSQRPVRDGAIGELWVDSPSKALGYFGQQEISEATFRARLSGDAVRSYLRTGDLGFLWDGEVFITGRLKDVIILRGRNLYPEDLEETVRHAHAMVRPGGIAAFPLESTPAGRALAEEQLAFLVELRGDDVPAAVCDEISRSIRARIARMHSVQVYTVVFTRPGAVLKTTSGKVRRSACRELVESGRVLEDAKLVRVVVLGPAPELTAGTEGATPTTTPLAAATPPRVDGVVDPRVAAMDDELRALAGDVVRVFQGMSRARRKRVFHPTATTLAGTLTVLAMNEAPSNPFFARGRVYPVILRHANGAQEDDAAWDNRGASLRVLDPAAPDRLDRPRLDLLLTTGECFSSRSARDFRAWLTADRAARERLVGENPHWGSAAWEMFRSLDSYTDVHYFTKVAQRWVAADGTAHVARFRLRRPDRRRDSGFLDPHGELLPPDRAARAPGDDRSPTYLHQELRDRLESGSVEYVLEVQVRPAESDPAAHEEALDASRPWPESRHRWHECARLRLDRVLPEAAIEPLVFNPANAPPELGLVLARSPDESASLNHLRSIVYEVAAAARKGEPVPERLAALLAPGVPAKASVPASSAAEATAPVRGASLRVAVVGGGVAGLTVARALEAAGATVTVFERAPEVGGKASSMTIDDRVFDLGAHLCSDAYEQLRALLDELGIPREAVSPVLLHDLDGGPAPAFDAQAIQKEFLRYHASVRPALQGILEPGFERHEARFATPLGAWAAQAQLPNLVASTALGFTASGYGYASDPELAALYFLKYAETATFSMDPTSFRYWTPSGGFGNVWKRVAAELADVRCGVTIDAIHRRDDGVLVHAAGEVHRFDRLVIAAPLDEAPRYLDASPAETELFAEIRYVDYATVVVSASGLPRDGFFLVPEHCADAASRGHVVAFHHRYPDSDVYVLWAYLDASMTQDDLLRCLRADADRMGGRVDAVHAVHRWRYFPHVAPQAMEAGFYRRFARLQGARHTYWTGGLFNFELVDCTMRHARALSRSILEGAAWLRVETAATEPTSPSAPPLALRAEGSAPRSVDHLLDYLQGVLRDELDLPSARLSPEDEFLSLGLDSVKSVQIFERISRDLDLVLAPILFFEHPTLAALARHLATELGRQHATAPRSAPRAPAGSPSGGDAPENAALDARLGRIEEALRQLGALVRKGAAPPAREPFVEPAALVGGAIENPPLEPTNSRWLLRGKPRSAAIRQRLICFAPAGGNAQMFAGWQSRLPPDVALYAVELPGRGNHTGAAMTDFAELTARIASEVEPLLDLPTAIFGHSFGALLAFEVTRRLLQVGFAVSRLFVSSFGAPSRLLHDGDRLEVWSRQRMSAAVWMDHQLMVSWREDPGARLSIPLTIFHASSDPIFRRENVERWADSTSADSVLHVVPGGHFHLIQGGLTPGLVAAHLLEDQALRGRPSPTPPRPEEGPNDGSAIALAPAHADAGGDAEARLRALDVQLASRCVTAGSWNIYDLAWAARAHAAPNGQGEPAFPEALSALLACMGPDGSWGALESPFPHATVLCSLVAANTLIQWDDPRRPEDRDFSARIEGLLDQARRAGEAMQDRIYRGLVLPHGRFYKFPALLGQWLFPAYEARIFAERGGRYFTPERAVWLQSHLRESGVPPSDELFKKGDWKLSFAEYFPAEVVTGQASREHAERVAPDLPGFSTAFAARYFDETRCVRTQKALAALLTEPLTGLRPKGRLQEVYFALYYLDKTGLDLGRLCPTLVDYLQSTQRTYGVGLDDGGIAVDIDSTTIALHLSARHGLRSPIERGARILDGMWDEQLKSYRTMFGTFFNVGILMRVLNAYLVMDGVSAARKRELWQRTVEQLEVRQWLALENISPFYVWEGVMSVCFEYEAQFPEDGTQVHHEALAQLLALQDADGGFHSYLFKTSSLEETALALLALKSAVNGALPAAGRGRVVTAMERAQRWLEASFGAARASGPVSYPALWVGKLLFAPTNLVDAILTASLLKPVRAG